ncbi:MAG: hypothetical protein NT027_12205 [Proteobacteria bacterium]|nr:hypothetical protein [Pseudomonadota bacterium]
MLNVMTKAKRIFVGSCIFGAVATTSYARGILLAQEEVIGEDGYNKTYNDSSKSFKDRMKDARSEPVSTPGNEKGGFALGINGAFGPVYDAEPKSTSGMGFAVGVEPGFVIQNDSFSRIELGVGIAYNSFSWKNPDVTHTMAPLTILPKVGWGASLGNNLQGVLKVGFGVGMKSEMTTKQTVASVTTTCKTDSPTGFLLSGDYDVVYGSNGMQFLGGIGAVHHKYTFGSSTCGSTKIDLKGNDGVVNLNFVNLHGGVRFQF